MLSQMNTYAWDLLWEHGTARKRVRNFVTHGVFGQSFCNGQYTQVCYARIWERASINVTDGSNSIPSRNSF